MSTLAHKKYLRPALILSTDTKRQTCRIKLIDSPHIDEQVCPLPHPFSSPGWGIFAVPTVGTRVYVYFTSRERPRIVSTIPLNQFSEGDFENSADVTNVCVDEVNYPRLRSGELALQSVSGSNMVMNNQGDIKLQINNSSIEYNGILDTSSEYFSNRYFISEAGRQIVGVVRRDIRERPPSTERTQDKLISLKPDFKLADIGRNPRYEVQTITVDARVEEGDPQLSIIRNPALVENRHLIHEYALSDYVQTFDLETGIIDGVTEDENNNQIFFNKNRRDLSRTDVLNLGLHLPNNLLEKVEGTLVDYYGNVLDLNRNIIDFSGIEKRPGGESAVKRRLQTELTLLRRSIKYHFEINSKKEVLAEKVTPVDQSGESAPILDALGDETNSADEAMRTGYSHSRFSVDVDGEGLTKINIPASSNQGNIPLLSRYINSFDPADRNSGEFRDPNKKDVRHIGFGQPAIDVDNTGYLPENVLESGSDFAYGTTYHEFGSMVDQISQQALFTETLINNIDNPAANAGGRSLHLNLDGSMDLNVGRDVADKKSVVVDTAGSIVSMIGRDKNDNSIVSQIDGNVKVQVGGSSTPGDEELTENIVEIAVKTPTGYHKITIDGENMFFDSPGNILMKAAGNIGLDAGGELMVNGVAVYLYGGVSDDGQLTSRERIVLPSGQDIR